MRVIHLIGGGDTGGAKTHVLNLLKELNHHIDAQLFCFRKGDFSEDAEKMGIPIHVIDSGNPLVGYQELKKLLAGQKVDIIHCHGARGNLMGNLIKKYCKAPVVTTVHSDYRLDYLGRPVARLSYGNINMVALRRVNFYIGVADPMTDILIQRGFPRRPDLHRLQRHRLQDPHPPPAQGGVPEKRGHGVAGGGRDRRHRGPALPCQGHPHPAEGHEDCLQGGAPSQAPHRRGTGRTGRS